MFLVSLFLFSSNGVTRGSSVGSKPAITPINDHPPCLGASGATTSTTIHPKPLSIDVSNSPLDSSRIESIFRNVPQNQPVHFTAQLCQLTPALVARLLLDGDDKNSQHQPHTPILLYSLHVGWNRLFGDVDDSSILLLHKSLHTALAELPELTTYGLECSGMGPSTARVLAEGLLERWQPEEKEQSTKVLLPKPLSLYLARNPLGDAGMAALAAAIRTATTSRSCAEFLLDTLDCAACQIGDAGVEALALALENDADTTRHYAIRHLILSHNALGSEAMRALGCCTGDNGCQILDVSGNTGITDVTVRPLVAAQVRPGRTLILRSCTIQAGGAEWVGTRLREIVHQRGEDCAEEDVHVDLSGNPLGVLRGKAKKENAYSASRIKSTVTATASAYMTQGLGLLKKGLGSSFSTLESDDEAEDDLADELEGSVSDEKMPDRCGLKALANAFIDPDTYLDENHSPAPSHFKGTIHIGLRRTFCDTAGAHALAAMIVAARQQGVTIHLDMVLNPALEDDMVDALHGENEHVLQEMAEQHFNMLEIWQETKQRTAQAAKTARLHQEHEDMEWGFDPEFAEGEYDDHEHVEENYEDDEYYY